MPPRFAICCLDHDQMEGRDYWEPICRISMGQAYLGKMQEQEILTALAERLAERRRAMCVDE